MMYVCGMYIVCEVVYDTHEGGVGEGGVGYVRESLGQSHLSCTMLV